jgi:hypothetical protein
MTYADKLAADASVTTYVEVHPIVQRHLATDPLITSLVNQRVWAGEWPKPQNEIELPAIKFRFPQISALAPPSLAWWTHTGQVDVVADTELLADELGAKVIRSLMLLQQTSHDEGVIGTLSGWDVESAVDSAWSPSKPRRIVSVTLTARRE